MYCISKVLDFIGNYFSYAMPDAWVNDVYVIEYSHYSDGFKIE